MSNAPNLVPVAEPAEPDPLGELVDQMQRVLAKAATPVLVRSAREAAQEAGVSRARTYLGDALDLYDGALQAKRAAYAAMRDAERRYDDAVAEAAYVLDGRFESSGNKTFLIDGEQRVPMTADERKAWKDRHARKDPEVRKVEAEYRKAEADYERCTDELHLAERRFTAARIDLEAAVAHLSVLEVALRPVTPVGER